jgi:hypothetical protein
MDIVARMKVYLLSDRERRTRTVRIGAFLAGALIDCIYLLGIGTRKTYAYILMIAFAGLFMIFASELVAQRRLLNIDIKGFALFAGEGDTPLNGFEKLLVTLAMGLMILFFQTLP